MFDGPPAREATACARKGGDGVGLEIIAEFALCWRSPLLGFNQPTYRGIRVNGVRVATWSSQHWWSGDGRPEAEWLQ